MTTGISLTKINFFICSTYLDLRDYRAAVIKKLQSKAAVINAQEFFGARDQKPIETCLEEVHRSKVFVMTVGPRYGSLVPGHESSYSEIEFDEASKLHLPRFVYLLDDSAAFPVKFVSRGEDAKKLDALKQRIRDELTVNTFFDQNDLAERVYSDLVRELPKRGIAIGEDEKEITDTEAIVSGFKRAPMLYVGRTVRLRLTLEYCESASSDECAALTMRYGAAVKCHYRIAKDDPVARLLEYGQPEIFATEAIALEVLSIPGGAALTVTTRTAANVLSVREPVYLEERFEPTAYMRGAATLVDYISKEKLISGFLIQELRRE